MRSWQSPSHTYTGGLYLRHFSPHRRHGYPWQEEQECVLCVARLCSTRARIFSSSVSSSFSSEVAHTAMKCVGGLNFFAFWNTSRMSATRSREDVYSPRASLSRIVPRSIGCCTML